MSSSQDNKIHDLNAKTSVISDTFNKQNSLEDRIRAASPEAQAKIRDRQQLRDERLAKEKRDQKFYHGRRVDQEVNRMLKEYILEDVPRPDTAASKQQDIAIIEQQAEERVTAKEAHFLNQIEKHAEKDVQHILSRDKQHTQSHDHSNHDHER